MTSRVTRVVNVRYEACDVYIGRANPRYGFRASKWANPFRLKGNTGEARMECIAAYREYLMGRPDLLADIGELVGKKLGCWCASPYGPEIPCHGDVLKELADREVVIHG